MQTTSKQLTLHFTCPFEVYDVEWRELVREVNNLLLELGLNAVTATVIEDEDDDDSRTEV